jgi:ribosomal protein L11 methyltransferase
LNMHYSRLQVVCDPNFSDILMAEIAEAGYDTFMETEKGFEAYGEENQVNAALVAGIRKKYHQVNPLLFFQDRVARENWNEEWEKNVEPIIVEDQCLIRAAFHIIEKKYPYEIIITPKMSFGTGHHATTQLMIGQQLQLEHHGKRVMDAGCGTGVLSIMAHLRGAAETDAFDIDEWSVLNARENVELNRAQNVAVWQGKLGDRPYAQPFDIILANINKNVLLADMPAYALHTSAQGHLLLSGFYRQDVSDLTDAARQVGFVPVRETAREDWASLLLQKK